MFLLYKGTHTFSNIQRHKRSSRYRFCNNRLLIYREKHLQIYRLTDTVADVQRDIYVCRYTEEHTHLLIYRTVHLFVLIK